MNHVHTSLARQAYNLDNLGAYQASALSVRDNLLVRRAISVLPLNAKRSSALAGELE